MQSLHAVKSATTTRQVTPSENHFQTATPIQKRSTVVAQNTIRSTKNTPGADEPPGAGCAMSAG